MDNKELLFKDARHIFNKLMRESACMYWAPTGITEAYGMCAAEMTAINKSSSKIFCKIAGIEIYIGVADYFEWRVLKDADSYDEHQALGIRTYLPEEIAGATFAYGDKKVTFVPMKVYNEGKNDETYYEVVIHE